MTSRREQFRAIFLATVMVVSMVAMGATALAGSAAADIEADDTGGDIADDELVVEFNSDAGINAGIIAGSDEQELPRLDLKEQDAGILTDETDITLPDNMTFNTDESDPTFSGAVGIVDDDEFISDDTFRIVHDGATDEERDLRVNGLVVDTDADIDAERDGIDLPLEVDTGAGDDEFDDLFQVRNNEISGDGTTVPADGSAGLGADIEISVPSDTFELDDNDNLPLAEGQSVEISPNATAGITFDEDETELDEDEITVDAGDGDGNIDFDSISVDENALTFTVNESFALDDNPVINIGEDSGLELAAEPDADDDSELDMFYHPTNSTESVEAESNYEIEVQNPDFDIFDGDTKDDIVAPAGIENQVADSGTFTLDGEDAMVNIEVTSTGQIQDGQNVTLVTNTTEVTFSDKDGTNDELGVAFINDDNAIVNEEVADLHVDDNELTFEVDEERIDDSGLDDGDVEDGHGFAIHNGPSNAPDGLAFNVSDGIEDETNVGFELLTGDDEEVVSEPNNDNTISAERTDVDLDIEGSTLNEDFFPVDDAGHAGINVDLTASAPDADTSVFDADDVFTAGDDIYVADEGTNVTIDLSDTGVTFDQRTDESEIGPVNADQTALEDSFLEAELTEGLVADGSEFDFSLSYNVTADATDTDIDVTLNNTFTETIDSDTADAEDAIPDDIRADEEESSFDPADLEPDEVDVGEVDAGETETVIVQAFNDSSGAPFGGADVNLDLIDAPDDGLDASDVLNETSLTTGANDFNADVDSPASTAFNFTGTEVGDYSVNATVDDNDHVLVNFTVDAAEAESLDVEAEESAFAGGTDSIDENLRTGIFNVTLEDEFGNPTTDGAASNIELNVELDQSIVEAGDNLDDDGAIEDPFDTVTDDEIVIADTDEFEDGFFYVAVSSTAGGTHDVNLALNGKGDTPDITSDDDDVTFYAKADNAELDVGDGELNIDDDEREIEANVEVDGELIDVPRLTAEFDVDNESVATLDDDEAETDNSGFAAVNVTPEELGSTTIDVEFTDERADDQSATADISVVETSPNFEVDVDDDNVVEGNDITIDVEVDNTGDADGEQEVEIEVEGEDISASEMVELDAGDSTTESFDLNTADLEADDYTMVASSDDDEAEATLTVEEAVVELDVTLDDIDIFEGNTTDVNVDVENTGNTVADEIDVTLDIDDLDELEETVEDLSDGDTETVTFEDVETDDLEPDEYDMEATATHDDDEASDTATLTVEEVEDEDDDGIPGFTAGIAALALLGAALLALRLRSQE